MLAAGSGERLRGSWVLKHIQKISRRMYSSYMMPRSHSNTIFSVYCGSCRLLKHQQLDAGFFGNMNFTK